MVAYTSAEAHPAEKQYKEWDYYEDDEGNQDTRYVWEYFPTESAYLQFAETLALSAETFVTIGEKRDETTGVSTPSGNPTLKGSVFGGSESGFVYHDTDVEIQNGTVKGDAFAGGRGLESFAEAGRVRGNTNLTISNGAVEGNVYGGGSLGDVGTINKDDQTNYNYVWKNSDANGNNLDSGNNNTAENNKITGTNKNTGICTVTIEGGTIGTSGTVSKEHGNVFGAGRGSSTTWWCEKAIAYATSVSVSGSTTVVNGNVYGGGEVGRVEDDAKVVIGVENASGESAAPTITGSVYGAGAGLATHGYSALVRGNAAVTVQGTALVGGSVYGGGEIASVGKFTVVSGLPKEPKNGGTCTVVIQDNAKIGSSGTGHNVYGACKGVTPAYNNTVGAENRSKSMQLVGNAPSDNSLWSYYNNDSSSPFIWRYYATEAEYLNFLKTLALTSNTHVTIDENANVYGSVFGGGERGITLGGVDVNMTNGTVHQDVYGGGSLADSNASMWDAQNSKLVDYVTLPDLVVGSSATGYYTGKSSDALITATDATVVSGTTYYARYKTNVNLLGGTVVGDAYGGGLGQLARNAVTEVLYTAEDEEVIAGTKQIGDVKVAAQAAVSAVEAKVYGDVLVELNGTTTKTTTGGTTVYDTTPTSSDKKGCTVGRIFGCNNLNGSPKGEVLVHVHATQKAGAASLSVKSAATKKSDGDYDVTTFDVKAVYGGGNMAAYEPVKATGTDAEKAQAYTNVIIDGCQLTSIGQVYGGGNAASAPATEVVVNGTYEIGDVFGGGNGKDAITVNGVTQENPGANVGYLAYTSDSEKADAAYGSGKAHATIYGGTVHAVYGGSNSKGNIRVESRTTLEDQDGNDCEFNVGEAYGGGHNAPQDGDAVLEIGCISGLGKAYGGAANADVNGNVMLNITNGTYGQVFGGNDAGGAIRGSITVNIEETGCRPIIIGELYGGGNEAAYSVYGYDANGDVLTSGDNPVADPQVNVKSFTSIGKIFGGGYGASATMVGNPQVNINVYEGKYYNSNSSDIKENARVVGSTVKYSSDDSGYADGFPIPSHAKGKIGAINTVFGGGNAAKVIGNPTVNVGTEAGDEVYAVVDVATGADVKGLYTRSGEGTTESPYTYTEITTTTPAKSDTTYYLKTTKAVDIRGNVFGGGNEAEVEGDTNVVIGRKEI